MTRRQLQEDLYEGQDGAHDPEEDQAQLEHYQLHGNRPRLMPDLTDIAGRMFVESFRLPGRDW